MFRFVVGLLTVVWSCVALCQTGGQEKDACPLSSLTDLAIMAWPHLDADGSHGISYQEVLAGLPPEMIAPDSGFNFSKADNNYNGVIDPPEVRGILGMIHPNVLWLTLAMVDTNDDNVLQYSEVSSLVLLSYFELLDANDNEVLDCGDMPVWPPEGWTPPPPEPCEIFINISDVYDALLPIIDRNGNNAISVVEARAAIPGFDAYLASSLQTWETMWENLYGSIYAEIGTNESIALYQSFGGTSYPVYLFDSNGDYFLSMDEVAEWFDQQQFDVLDTNHNEYIDCEEFTTFLAAIIQQNQLLYPPLSISRFHYPRAVEQGGTLRLSVETTGAAGECTYTWRYNGTVIPWADGPVLTIASVSFADAGAYSCEVMDAYANVAVATAHVSVEMEVPVGQGVFFWALLTVLGLSGVIYTQKKKWCMLSRNSC